MTCGRPYVSSPRSAKTEMMSVIRLARLSLDFKFVKEHGPPRLAREERFAPAPAGEAIPPLTETQRLTVEMLLGEALEKVGWLQPDPLPAGTTRIDLRDATTIAARNLTEDASLDELREMVCDLRAVL